MAQLVSLVEVKDYLIITSNTFDARLSNIIVFASDLVESYCARTFTAANVVEYRSGGTPSIFVNQIPVNNVWSISEYDGTQYVPLISPGSGGALPNTVSNANSVPGFTYNSATGEIVRDTSTGSFEVSLSGLKTFANYPNGIQISYNGGYTTIPYDLRLAVLDIIKDIHKGLDNRSSRLEGESVSEFPMTGGFPPHVRRVLDLYRLIV